MVEETSEELPSLFKYLVTFIKNPVHEIQSLPKIHWLTLIIFQFFLSLFSVVFANLLAPYVITFANVLISLTIALTALGLVSLFLYYYFLIIFERQLEFKLIFTMVLFAHIPFALFHLASYFFPPADLLGLGISALLMIIGLVENFKIPRKLAIQLIGALYALFVVYWIISWVQASNISPRTVPQSMDTLEREVQAIEQ